ncbi:MAG: hypothetical protein COT74_08560 [Bdellovibrionales bacterium CG10_big_fil_rev_8_21_14_0_10_45_34]|nr:MAG: hypothetical protein COT74_08560 [Bdellovibrionales bacterium CG10_big_fil_rev_8_21_14_0_10_45_34]
MGDAKLVWDQSFQLTENYRVELKVYEVEPTEKYPEGIKARFVLIDMGAVTWRDFLLITMHPLGSIFTRDYRRTKQPVSPWMQKIFMKPLRVLLARLKGS